MKRLVLTLCVFAVVLPNFSQATGSTVKLADATVMDFVKFVNRWEDFKSALADYMEREKEFFPNCDINIISANTISAFGLYDVRSAKKILKQENFEEIKSKMISGENALIGVDTADPCGHDHRSWVFVGSEEGFKIISDFIIVE